MKIICAWCQTLIGYKCPLCGAPMVQDPNRKSWLICTSRGTPIHFSTENMTESHGICPDCLQKFRGHQERLCPLTPEEIIAQAEAEERRIQATANPDPQTEDTGNLLAETMSGFDEPPDRTRE